MSAAEGYRLVEQFPGMDDYRRLRSACGLSPKSVEAAVRGLANTLYGVSVIDAGRVIGMGRIIGDG
ncbi:MAG: N-acetyltransferase, partial [Pseudoxanthomonas sp.]